MTSQQKCRAYCFTWNNYSSCPLLLDCMQYLVYGFEVSKTGTKHLQGFVYFNNQRTFKSASILFKGAHLERARTVSNAIVYCKKDGDFVEFGVAPMCPSAKGANERDRWANTRDRAKEGDLDNIDPDIYVRYYTTLKRIRDDHKIQPTHLDVIENEWIYGPTGVGKSKFVRDTYPGAYIKMQNKWWDGYDGEDVVVIDDLHPNWTGAVNLKNWADHYAFRAEYKGGSMMIRPKKIIVTSNYAPDEVYTHACDIEPILRRFELKYMPSVYAD